MSTPSPADLAFRAALDDNLSRLLLEAHQHLLHACDHSPSTPYEVRTRCLICVPQRELAAIAKERLANPVAAVEAKERQAIETLLATHNAEFVTRLLADLATQVPA